MSIALTLDSLKAMAEKIPPMPFLASSKFFERDKAIKFQFKMREYIGAHPEFWGLLPEQPPGTGILQFSPVSIPIYDLDLDGNEDKRKEFFTALQIIMSSCAGPIEDAIATAIERGFDLSSKPFVRYTGP